MEDSFGTSLLQTVKRQIFGYQISLEPVTSGYRATTSSSLPSTPPLIKNLLPVFLGSLALLRSLHPIILPPIRSLVGALAYKTESIPSLFWLIRIQPQLQSKLCNNSHCNRQCPTYDPAREGPHCSVKSPLVNICLLWLFVVWGYDVEWAFAFPSFHQLNIFVRKESLGNIFLNEFLDR